MFRVAIYTALCTSAVLAVYPAKAQSIYGLSPQSIYIPAVEFTSVSAPDCPLVAGESAGYLFNPCRQAQVYLAPLRLPEGAFVTSYIAHYFDTAPFGSMSTSLARHGIFSTGGGLPIIENHFGGQGTTSVDSPEYVARSANFDGFVYDTYDHKKDIHYLFTARLTLPPGKAYGFRGLWIHYQRQASPARAISQFVDVPTTHPHYQNIAQLAQAGVTVGCGNNLFCPNQPVTRAQMATFLSRALGLQWDISADATAP